MTIKGDKDTSISPLEDLNSLEKHNEESFLNK